MVRKNRFTALSTLMLFAVASFARLAGADSLYFSRASSSTWDNGSTQNWGTVPGGPYTTSAWISGSDAHFEGTGGTVTASGTIASVNAISFDVLGYTLTGGTVTLTGDAVVSSAGGSTTIESVLAGSSGFTKTGSGEIILRAVSTYTGDTVIGQGRIVLGSGNDRLPTGTTVILGSDATSGVLSLGATSTNRNQTLAGLVTSGTGTGNRVVGAGTTTTYSTLGLDIAGTNVFGGILGGTGAADDNKLNLVKLGTGTLTLTGLNTHVGTTTVSAGTLLIEGEGRIATASGVVVASGATFEVATANWAMGNVISGAGGLTKSGTVGDLRVTGMNSYTGPTRVTGTKTLRAGSSQAFGVNSALTVESGAFVELNGYSLAFGSIAGSGTIQNRIGDYGSGSDSPTVLTTGGNNGSTTFSGVIEDGVGGVPLALRKVGSGTLTLQGANTYTGNTLIEDGRLVLGGGNNRLAVGTTVTLGSGAISGVLGVGGGANSRDQELAGLVTSGTGTANRVVGGGTSTFSTLTLNIASTNVFGGILGGPDGTENQLSLVKTGSGVLTLTGVNTYVGTTTVSTGTLRMQDGGRIANASNVTIASGASLVVDTTDWTFGGGLSGPGTLTKLGDGTLTLTGGLGSFTGSTQLQDGVLKIQGAAGYALASAISIAPDAELHLGPTAGVNISGSISGSGPIRVLAGGFYRLSGSNSFTSDLQLDGRVRVGSATALGNVNNAVTMGSGAYLDLYGWNTTIGSLAGTGTVRNESDGGAGSANPVTLATGGNNASTTFSGVIQDGVGGRSVALTKNGTGTFTLAGAS
ncbi:MAG: autotransporter-associated beta strand repeat-containing protein, partial [Patescibacteria group bacterium]|nr:autotransporter-associated beta strand repeat-containing protein [Patescibacteria group bacterium]